MGEKSSVSKADDRNRVRRESMQKVKQQEAKKETTEAAEKKK
jgi:hypothetical protein